MSVHRARVTVRLKAAILDPQGRAVAATLRRLGHEGLTDLRVGKVIEFTVRGTRDEAWDQVRRMTDEVLANPVIEDAEIELHPAGVEAPDGESEGAGAG